MATTRKASTKANAGDTRERIMEVAEDAFAFYGFSGASLQDIADRVGIKKASLFYYFKGKEELYAEVIQRVFKAIEELLFPHIYGASNDYAERIKGMVANTFDLLAKHPNYARMLYRELLDNEDRVAEVSGMLFGPLLKGATEFLQKGIDEGQLKNVDPMHYIISNLGSITFYFVSGPLVEPFWRREILSPQVLAERREELINYCLNAIIADPQKARSGR
jgi:TetR/AcrR family transcriptional regulator